jgi:hypothetical protein
VQERKRGPPTLAADRNSNQRPLSLAEPLAPRPLFTPDQISLWGRDKEGGIGIEFSLTEILQKGRSFLDLRHIGTFFHFKV